MVRVMAFTSAAIGTTTCYTNFNITSGRMKVLILIVAIFVSALVAIQLKVTDPHLLMLLMLLMVMAQVLLVSVLVLVLVVLVLAQLMVVLHVLRVLMNPSPSAPPPCKHGCTAMPQCRGRVIILQQRVILAWVL